VVRQLRHDMGSGAETVDADASRVAGHPQRAITYEPGAQPWTELDVGESFGQPEAIARIGSHVFGVAAVERTACELCRVTQVFVSRAAIPARSTGAPEPGHADAVAY
jgi:hypothetical protein